ncbi:MAG TPA: hypothetical protein VMN36_08885 [Verrucomicrobiales bacterium]|nr:hypothetical protein [Verrucomicrobiales bacterium]
MKGCVSPFSSGFRRLGVCFASRFAAALLVSAAVFGLSQCAQVPSMDYTGRAADPAVPMTDAAAASSSEYAERPGLATGWGKPVRAGMRWSSFNRAGGNQPWAVASFHYDDAPGARALSRSLGGSGASSRSSFHLAGGAVEAGLKDRFGRWYPAFRDGDRAVVVGTPGSPYRVVLRNRTGNALELVVSVDGLDVIDGRTASYRKRGYLVDGGDTLEIAGFRTSMDEVAGFRFSSVSESYAAQRHGDTRNVGVIGVALFHEPGRAPWSAGNRGRRRDAEPFPGSFAVPPDGGRLR